MHKLRLTCVLASIAACNGADDGRGDEQSATATITASAPTLTSLSDGGTTVDSTGEGATDPVVTGGASADATTTGPGGTTADANTNAGGCVADVDCPEGQACEAGECVAVPCTADNVGVGNCVCAPGASEPCYAGPNGTQDVGVCVGGTRSCDPSGTVWGACEGQVIPGNEACANALDDNCNGMVDEDVDADGDGFTVCGGDCCDQDGEGCEKGKLVNPGAFEVAANELDDDCDGMADNVLPDCDDALNVASNDAMDGARAVDLCKVSTGEKDWGVVSAKYVQIDGGAPPNAQFDVGHGLVAGFGPNVMPKKGARMLGLSSGAARQPTDPGYQSPGGYSKGYNSAHPQGFPKESPACPGVVTGTPYDSAALELQIRVPTNAYGFAFDFSFYTYEWPGYVCSKYNDFFVAALSPIPMGQTDGNIAFDMMGNPISVNNAFLDVCGCINGPPCNAGGKQFLCPLGTAELTGTGFESHAATSWLTTTAPVVPGSVITIRWGTYDSGDGALDSTAILDHWRWEIDPNTKVETIPQ
ncbi:MAG: choice-of-anchor L domain-containing protein [Nannocystis sp.]|nr:choice-of-anchor L domain-containing protein [Nannocystis sp.]MBA3547909.1 choice-of-anchor L domain-containing protein [Nannocystis sp.]